MPAARRKKATAISTTIANPIRTGVQLVPAIVITEFIDSFILDFTEKQYAASVGLLLLVTSWIQNGLENLKGRGFLREVADATPRGEVVQEVETALGGEGDAHGDPAR